MDHYQWNYYTLHQCPKRIYHAIVGQASNKLVSFIIFFWVKLSPSFVHPIRHIYPIRQTHWMLFCRSHREKKTLINGIHQIYMPPIVFTFHMTCSPQKKCQCMLELLLYTSKQTQRSAIRYSRHKNLHKAFGSFCC